MVTVHSNDAGRWLKVAEGAEAFVPNPLPRELDLDPPLVFILDRASRAVAKLSGLGETLPNRYLLVRPFVRREAVLSSRIEGTQASLSDLLEYEAAGKQRGGPGDVHEVANYVAAIDHGLARLSDLPLSMRLMNEIHAELLRDVRGRETTPGELRVRQVWIGAPGTPIEEARYVPPPADLVRDLLTDLEVFLNEEINMPPLVQVALMHYQFEAIHPYNDGNGRIGRLLIVLFLCAKDVLPTPLLYLSAYFEELRSTYYDELLNVSTTGDWKPWLRFFLRGVEIQAQDAIVRSRRLLQLLEDYRERLKRQRSANAYRLLDELFQSPFMTTPLATRLLGITNAAARRLLRRLVQIGILQENTSTRPALFVATDLLREIERPIEQEDGEQLVLGFQANR